MLILTKQYIYPRSLNTYETEELVMDALVTIIQIETMQAVESVDALATKPFGRGM